MTDHVIGVDIGTQSTKALLCDATGRIVAQHSKSYRPDTPKPMWAEQWPAVWVDAVFECITACVAKAAADTPGFSAHTVRAICISGLYGGSGIPVDEAIAPLHPCHTILFDVDVPLVTKNSSSVLKMRAALRSDAATGPE